MVIMMVNGSLGVGVAVAGTFSLVKFRSYQVPQRKSEPSFWQWAQVWPRNWLSWLCGFVYRIVNGVLFIYTASQIGEKKSTERILKLTIPEDLDYTGVFDDLFNQYTSKCERVSVKTINMGSLFKVTYDLELKDLNEEKAFIDDLRCRNGNLEIMMSSQVQNVSEL